MSDDSSTQNEYVIYLKGLYIRCGKIRWNRDSAPDYSVILALPGGETLTYVNNIHSDNMSAKIMLSDQQLGQLLSNPKYRIICSEEMCPSSSVFSSMKTRQRERNIRFSAVILFDSSIRSLSFRFHETTKKICPGVIKMEYARFEEEENEKIESDRPDMRAAVKNTKDNFVLARSDGEDSIELTGEDENGD